MSPLPAGALGLDPGPVRDPAPLRLVHAGGDPPGRRGDGRDRRLPRVGRHLLRPLPPRAGRQPPGPRLHQHLLLDARRRRAARRRSARPPAPTATRPATAARSRADGEIYVSGFECLGACDLAPMASIDERYYGPLDDADALAAIAALRDGGEVLPERRDGDPPAGGRRRRLRVERAAQDVQRSSRHARATVLARSANGRPGAESSGSEHRLAAPHVPSEATRSSRERRLASLAARQGRIVGRRSAAATRLHLRGDPLPPAKAARLRRVHPNVYIVGPGPLTQHGRQLRRPSRLPAGPRDQPHQLPRAAADVAKERGVVHVTTTNRNGPRRLRGVTVHRVRHLHPADVTRIDDLPCTTLPRALLDVAETEPAYVAGEGLRGRRPQGLARLRGDRALRPTQPGPPRPPAPHVPRRRVRPHPRRRGGHRARVPAPPARGGASRSRSATWMFTASGSTATGRADRFVVELDSKGFHKELGGPRAGHGPRRRTSSASASAPCASPAGACGTSARALVDDLAPAHEAKRLASVGSQAE